MGLQIPWIDEARELAAQCWCDIETEDRVFDSVLAEAIAKRIAVWMETAAQNQQNTEYYRGLVERCGMAIGERAFIADDGTKSEDILCAKIPEIVETLIPQSSKGCIEEIVRWRTVILFRLSRVRQNEIS
jgi:hypothetical protein